jgi:hypothetical protein
VPLFLLLKVVQSVEVRLPVFKMEALGMEMVRLAPEMVAVNREPVVLVATTKAACLLLKVVQSVLVNWPEWLESALGKLITKALPVPLVEVVMLKLLPAVPVAMLLTKFWGMLTTKALVEVEMEKTSLTAVVVETLAMMLVGTTFKDLMLFEASVITNWEAEVEAIMTLPEGVIWKKDTPEVEAAKKIGRVWFTEEAVRAKVAAGVEELMVKVA